MLLLFDTLLLINLTDFIKTGLPVVEAKMLIFKGGRLIIIVQDKFPLPTDVLNL